MEKYKVDIKGHAGYADPGKDIVCAGVSTLALTLIEFLRQMERDRKLVYLISEADKGSIEIEFCPVARCEDEAFTIFDFFMTGINRLYENYSDYIEMG